MPKRHPMNVSFSKILFCPTWNKNKTSLEYIFIVSIYFIPWWVLNLQIIISFNLRNPKGIMYIWSLKIFTNFEQSYEQSLSNLFVSNFLLVKSIFLFTTFNFATSQVFPPQFRNHRRKLFRPRLHQMKGNISIIM